MKRYFLLILIVVLSACGDSKPNTPQLAAPPTRTPAPAASESDTVVAGLDVISLRPALESFLAASGEIAPLDQTITFMQMVAAPDSCLNDALDGDQFDALFTLGAIHWPMADFSAWQAAADAFPEADLIQQINALAPDLAPLLPEGELLRVCVIPVPHLERTEIDPQVTPAPGLRFVNHWIALKDLNAVALRGNAILVTCSAGADCLDDVRVELIRAASMAYQERVAGVELPALALLDRMVYEGRADDYVQRVEPGHEFEWNEGLSAADEENVWHSMRFSLTEDTFRYAFINDYLYGTYGSSRYPAWGGMVIGDRIVQMYLSQHPDLAWTDLVAVPPQELFEASGYDPDLMLFNLSR
jgi:hypothetical protein